MKTVSKSGRANPSSFESNQPMQNQFLYLCATSLIVCAGASLNAAPAEAPASPEKSALTEEPTTPDYWRWSVAVEAGTTGFGLSGAWRLSDHLGLRLGADFLQYSLGDTAIKSVEYDLKARLLSESLILDVYPWKKSSFHVGVGLMFNQNELSGDATSAGRRVIFPTAGGGALSVKIDQQPVNPYLSIGGNLFYFDRAHRWALAGEIGVAYTGTPSVSSSWSGYDGSLVENAVNRNEEALKDFADQFSFYPVVKLYVSFSF